MFVGNSNKSFHVAHQLWFTTSAISKIVPRTRIHQEHIERTMNMMNEYDEHTSETNYFWNESDEYTSEIWTQI